MEFFEKYYVINGDLNSSRNYILCGVFKHHIKCQSSQCDRKVNVGSYNLTFNVNLYPIRILRIIFFYPRVLVDLILSLYKSAQILIFHCNRSIEDLLQN